MLTYADLLDHVLAYAGTDAGANASARHRQAVQAAVASVPGQHEWAYLWNVGRVTTSEPYSTGTIEYDHCVTPEHEALTRNGWKRREDLRVGEEILAYDQKTNTCRWLPIQGMHSFHLKGEVLEVRRRGFVVLRCTRNHRFPVSKRVGGNKTRTLQPCGFVTASELTPEHCVPLTAEAEFATDDDSILSAKQAAIVGWAVTDGWGLLGNRDYGARVGQSLAVNADKCLEIESLLGTKRSVSRDGRMASWSIPASQAREIRRVLRRVEDLPSVVTRLSRLAAMAMYDAMLAADGCCVSGGQIVFSQWREKRKPIAEAFQILSNMLGRAANLCEGVYDGLTRYQVTSRTSEHYKPARSSSWVPYEGLVWCPQVETGAWLCRHDGAVTVTGNSGGATERRLTLTGGTWPDWAAQGSVVISNVPYLVEARLSSTVLTLASSASPAADIASGTSYEIRRDLYALPTDFVACDEVVVNEVGLVLEWQHPRTWASQRRVNTGPGRPVTFSLIGAANDPGEMRMALWPAPNAVYYIDMLYRRKFRPLVYADVNTGLASGSASGTTITGSGTAFAALHVGSVIRLGADNQDAPTGPRGNNPALYEGTITAYTSATSVTVSPALPQAFDQVKYQISDPVDIEEVGMSEYLLRECERQFRLLARMKETDGEATAYALAFTRALEADTRFSGRLASDRVQARRSGYVHYPISFFGG